MKYYVIQEILLSFQWKSIDYEDKFYSAMSQIFSGPNVANCSKNWFYSYILDIAISDIFLYASFLLHNTNWKVEIDWIINRKWRVIVVANKLSLETHLECEDNFIIHVFSKGLKTYVTTTRVNNNAILCHTELYKKVDWREKFIFYEISFYSTNFLRNPYFDAYVFVSHKQTSNYNWTILD